MTSPFPAAHRVSLCMIVRDEERCLQRCLAAASPWVGEMVVVDTGSKDATVRIAEAAGARVVHEPWRDDFSLARNVALEAATTPWALVLDADDVLHVTDPAAFARDLLSDEDTALALQSHDLQDGGGASVGPALRLFRRDRPGMRYRGQVHEQLEAVADRRTSPRLVTFAHFVHDGYLGAVMRSRKKAERNLALARRQVVERDDDPFAWYCLGQALVALGTEETRPEAISSFRTSLARLRSKGLPESESYLVSLQLLLAELLRAVGPTGAAEEALDAALQHFSASPDLRFARAQLRLERGAIDAAATDLEVCLSDAARTFFVRQRPETHGHLARTQLARCELKRGRFVEAERLLRAATDEAPVERHPQPHLLLASLLLLAKAPAESEAVARRLLEGRPDDPEARLCWARSVLALGRRAEAELALAPLRGDPRAAALLGD